MRIAFFFIAILYCSLTSFSQTGNEKQATITFAGDKSKNSRTYIGEVKKGDPDRLRNELRQSGNYTGNVAKVHGNQDPDMNGYINYLSKNRKASEREKFRHLSDIYDIDEKKLEEGNRRYYQKYLTEKERVFTEEKRVIRLERRNNRSQLMTYREFQEAQKSPPQANNYIARNYKIKGKRFWSWRKFKYPPGPVSIIIKYKVREGNTVRTYVDVVDNHLSPGSFYELKYHGTNTRRNYYLEYQR